MAYQPKMTYPILQFFEYDHLLEPLKSISQMHAEMAHYVASVLPEDAETAAGLRKLLEAKDCFVRAKLSEKTKEQPPKKP